MKHNTRRWWWWIALSCMTIVLFTIPFSFSRVVGWTDSRSRWYLYIEHGVLHGNNAQMPRATPPVRPWCGSFEFRNSAIYDPWVLFPNFKDYGSGMWGFKFPLHFPLLALLLVVVFPALPPVVKRRRRKAGLCIKCCYNLTGNESGKCPECGTAIKRATQ